MSSNFVLRESSGEIPTNYTRKYADTRGWGDWEIVREVVQNSLDETGSAYIEKTSDSLIITDKGRGFNALHLLMGTSNKSKCHRGRFGEGLKIAILAAMNAGYTVDILTDSMHIIPQWKIIEIDDPTKGKLTAEIMSFKYEKVPPMSGTKVMIKGYTADTYQERFNIETNKKIIFKAKTDICEGKEYYSYIIDEDPKCIYVRNIFVHEISEKGEKALFSYDLFNVTLSTDRNIPSNYDIRTQIGRVWSYVSDPKLIDQFFKAVDSEMYESKSNLDSNVMSIIHNENAWKNGFKNHYGSNSFLKTEDERTRLAEYHSHFLKKGIYLPDGIRSTLNMIGIPDDNEVLAAIISRMPLGAIGMTPQQTDNMEYIRRIHNKLKENYYPKLNRVFAATKDSMVGSTGKVIQEQIYLSDDTLEHLIDALDTYGHECTHIAYPELSDNTSDFYSKIGLVMATITKVIVEDMAKNKPPPNLTW